MSVKIRLQRHGRKRRPFYFIVAADARAPRDGKFIEKLGTYDPTTVPATIELDRDRSLDWMLKGAQPSDTVRAILSYKGVMYKKHLMRGLRKGALTEAQVEEMYNKFIEEKEGKITTRIATLEKDKEQDRQARIAEEEKKRKEKYAEQVAALAKENESAEAEAETSEAETGTTSEVSETDTQEATSPEATTETEVQAETATEEVKEETQEEAKKEEPKAEAEPEEKSEAKPEEKTEEAAEEDKKEEENK